MNTASPSLSFSQFYVTFLTQLLSYLVCKYNGGKKQFTRRIRTEQTSTNNGKAYRNKSHSTTTTSAAEKKPWTMERNGNLPSLKIPWKKQQKCLMQKPSLGIPANTDGMNGRRARKGCVKTGYFTSKGIEKHVTWARIKAAFHRIENGKETESRSERDDDCILQTNGLYSIRIALPGSHRRAPVQTHNHKTRGCNSSILHTKTQFQISVLVQMSCILRSHSPSIWLERGKKCYSCVRSFNISKCLTDPDANVSVAFFCPCRFVCTVLCNAIFGLRALCEF